METSLQRLPTVAELFAENIQEAFKTEQLNLLLNQPPNEKWIKEHPYIAGYRYIPIDKVEYLLRRIFKRFKIEITGQGTSFNGVWVTVRVHYFNPVTNDFDFHDGIGASQLQTKKGTSPADLANINNGAISMAFPLAKTIAIKDACDHFGKLFGCDLNRKDALPFTTDANIVDAANKLDPQIQEQFDLMTDIDGLNKYSDQLPKDIAATISFRKAYNKRKAELTPKIN